MGGGGGGAPLLQKGDIIEFDYSGVAKQITLQPGRYIFECWGAAGGTMSATYTGGKGAYTKGEIFLQETKLSIYVGQNAGIFNGGGSNTDGYGKCGGGASDIRLTFDTWDNINSLRSRIMVAAGGASANARGDGYGSGTGGSAGGIIGYKGESINYAGYNSHSIGYGGEQTVGGRIENYNDANTLLSTTYPPNNNCGSFGKGGSAQSGGGSGYYGGAGAGHGSGGGGSSFISGHPGCNAIRDEVTTIHTNQPNHYSNFVFTKTIMCSGNESMPNPRGVENIIGNTGHGFVRITCIDTTLYIYFVKINNNIYYYNNEWKNLGKTEIEITISDIINYGMKKESKYLTKKYLHELNKFGESGSIEFITGSHTIDDLEKLSIIPHDETINLNATYNFNVIK